MIEFDLTVFYTTTSLMREFPVKTHTNIIGKAQKVAAKVCLSAMQRHVPKKTGRLELAIQISSKSGRSKYEKVCRIGPKKFSRAQLKRHGLESGAYYAYWVEYGTKNMKPHPYVRPAWDETKDEMLEIQQKMIGEYVEKEWNRRRLG